MTHRFMVEDTKAAQRNRERVAEDYGGDYYEEQRRILQATPFGSPMPDSLATGDLPQVEDSDGR